MILSTLFFKQCILKFNYRRNNYINNLSFNTTASQLLTTVGNSSLTINGSITISNSITIANISLTVAGTVAVSEITAPVTIANASLTVAGTYNLFIMMYFTKDFANYI